MRIQADDRRERLPIADAIRGTVHAVQFYETDDYLLQTLADYVSGAFAVGNAAVVVATGPTAPLSTRVLPLAGSTSTRS